MHISRVQPQLVALAASRSTWAALLHIRRVQATPAAQLKQQKVVQLVLQPSKGALQRGSAQACMFQRVKQEVQALTVVLPARQEVQPHLTTDVAATGMPVGVAPQLVMQLHSGKRRLSGPYPYLWLPIYFHTGYCWSRATEISLVRLAAQSELQP